MSKKSWTESSHFHITKGCHLVGYMALIERYGLKVFPPFIESYIAESGQRKTIVQEKRILEIYRKHYDPGDSLEKHLIFAIKYEGINLQVLSSLFEKVEPKEIESCLKSTPAGKYTRKLWFLYEFLTGRTLDIADTKTTNYVPLLDPKQYYTTRGVSESRYKITNNLLGPPQFCPLVRKEKILSNYENLELNTKATQLIQHYPQHILRRSIDYLYNKETKSSFEIERLTPDQKRASRFVELLRIAEDHEFFNKASLIELQNLTVDSRFANSSFRETQNYVGETVSLTNEVIHYIAPKPEDLNELMKGMFASYEIMMKSSIHPIIIASVISFGFVFMHPFDDGNGRLHRFLIHNILAKKNFTPKGMIFPVSATMLRHMSVYDETLELFSKPLLRLIDYSFDLNEGVQVHNETKSFYQYPDMTLFAKQLFEFIQETIETDLMGELNFLAKYDQTKKAVQEVVDMPDHLINLFIRFCLQNQGSLSGKKRAKWFESLTDKEIEIIENKIREGFDFH